jgi:hypothetical protein
MTTLDAAPLAALLHQLFIDADVTSALFRQQLDALPATQRRAMMASKDDYVAFYSRAKDAHLAVSRETGTLLYMLARAINARTIIEFGTSFGVSTLHLAAVKVSRAYQSGRYHIVLPIAGRGLCVEVKDQRRWVS